MKKSLLNLQLTVIMVQDPEIKSYTAFFKEFPDIFAIGEDEESTMQNLVIALQSTLKHKEANEDFAGNGQFDNHRIIEKPINFSNSNYEYA